MLGMLEGHYLECASSGRLPLSDILENGVRGAPDIDAVATRDERGMSILCWHYHDEDVPAPDARISIEITGVPEPRSVRRFSVDAGHSNAYGAWQQMGEPQHIEGPRLAQLQSAAQLAETDAPDLAWQDGRLTGSISLPRQGATVLRLEF
jgi:xylan 1,4-beta-xylosidase